MAQLPVVFLEGAPDLAVEFLSPGNTMAEMEERLLDYFDNGTGLVWLIHPTQRYALVYRCAQEPDRLLKVSDYLLGEEIIPNLRFLLGDLLQPLSF